MCVCMCVYIYIERERAVRIHANVYCNTFDDDYRL